ncbi:MAG: phosphoribosylamine--glycine ligase [Flavobacterium sp.]|jgi:phosphoribosylamine--glycine ligase
MKILVTGSGGREHALAWRAAQSPLVSQVFVAPGNAGTAIDDKISNINIDVMDFDSQIKFAKETGIDLTIIGPEAPLVEGVVDRFQREGLKCFGPNSGSAQLEGSKTFSKDFLARHNIPTADYASFNKVADALEYAHKMNIPMVIKADGLAAGKGVVIAQSHDEATRTIRDMMEGNAFDGAGSIVVIEEFLVGEEASFIVMVDGKNAIPFATSQDHKAAYDGDQGPNTGGMGAYSPAPVVTPTVFDKIMETVIHPTVSGMSADGWPYVGFLYAGLMIDAEGNSKVIEFNCRFGDPETQAIMMRMESDLIQLCLDAIDGELLGQKIRFNDGAALTVVMAAGGYPGSYDKDLEISNIPDENEWSKTFHAGTKIQEDKTVSCGGRVLGVTAIGSDVKEAQNRVYKIVEKIKFQDAQYRSDIGYRAIDRK